MKTFILFVFGVFEDMEDIEYFCLEVLGQSEAISEVRYVIESNHNIIVIFNSDWAETDLSEELYTSCINENIKFYFLLDIEGIVTSHLPEQVNNFIFKPKNIPSNTMMKVEYKRKPQPDMNLDDLLDKLNQYGIDSLTTEEKNFLDNFEN